MRAVALLLACISSVFAYTVTYPTMGIGQGWTNVGGQLLSWNRVSTDSLNFTVVLDNQSIQGFSRQVLAALVDGTLGKATMNPPSGGWRTGDHFRINLVQDDNINIDHIYAQSVEFSINTTTSSSSTDPASTVVYSTNTVVDTPSPSDSNLPAAASKSGALATYSANAGVISLLSLLAYALF